MNRIVPLETCQLPGQWEPQTTRYRQAEAEAIKQYAKAIKDWALLDDAIEQQIEDQRRFVEWWDENVGVRHGNPDNAERRSLMSKDKAEELFGISQQKVSRWNKRLENIGAYLTMLRGPSYRVAMASDDNTLNTSNTDNIDTSNTDDPAFDPSDPACAGSLNWNDTGGRNIRGTTGTGEFERYTPAKYIERARAVMGTIEVDPASCEVAQKIVKATTFFTVKDDGLTKEWIGNVWLNPPYHRDLGPKFIDKLVIERLAGRTTQAIMLTNNSTDTDWFVKAQAHCSAICFAKVRIGFLEEDGVTEVAPTQGQAFFYFGDNRELFCKEFCKIGFIATSFINYSRVAV